MINSADLAYLQHTFRDLTDFQAESVLDPIDPLKFFGFGGDTCLHIAAFRGDLRAINLLLGMGLDINAKGDMGGTPLHMAYLGKHVDSIELLLSRGANPNIKDEFGRIPSFSWHTRTK